VKYQKALLRVSKKCVALDVKYTKLITADNGKEGVQACI
jgi:hypothetical protein